MAWRGVTERFDAFCANVVLTDAQLNDGVVKSTGIISKLNLAYYEHEHQTLNGLWVGSWGKKTQARPPRDIDLFFELPTEVYHRIDRVTGNGQSQLLQEVKNILQPSYAQTDMRGDGQVVVVAFNSVTVEVIPCFKLVDGRYYICDTHDGGSWTIANPHAEITSIETGDNLTNGNLRRLIKLLKIWRRECNVPIKAYVLETLVTKFLQQSPWRGNSTFWYDWLVRDFFIFLVSRADTHLVVPDGQMVWLGNDWKSRAERARDSANSACVYEQYDMIEEAGAEWQKIFGTWIRKELAVAA